VSPTELDHYDTGVATGCGRPLKGCLIVTGLLFVGIIALLIYAMRVPAVREMMACRSHMVEAHEALRRYHDVNGKYPGKLSDLAPDYLRDPSVLSCPSPMSKAVRREYAYHVPPADAEPDFVVLECRMHSLGRGGPPSVYRMTVKGAFSVEMGRGRTKRQ